MEEIMKAIIQIAGASMVVASMFMYTPTASAYTKKQALNWCLRHPSCTTHKGETDIAIYDGGKLKFDCPIKPGPCVIVRAFQGFNHIGEGGD
jgi:hypothetical protein